MMRGPSESGNWGIGWSVLWAVAEEKIASGTRNAPRTRLRRCVDVVFIIKKQIAPWCRDCAETHVVWNRAEVVEEIIGRLKGCRQANRQPRELIRQIRTPRGRRTAVAAWERLRRCW